MVVCTFAVVLSVCKKAMDSSSGGSSSSGTAFADGSTVTISSMPDLNVASTATVSSMPDLNVATTATVSSMPELKVSSMPSVTVASQAMPRITATMFCNSIDYSSIPGTPPLYEL